jgi:diketogulonate reductase-like aldo/keto reductase
MSAIKVVCHILGYGAVAAGSYYLGRYQSTVQHDRDAEKYLKSKLDKLATEYADLLVLVEKASDKKREALKDRMEALKTKMAGRRDTLRTVTELRDEIVAILMELT